MTGDRIRGADLARVVACLMVFLHHLVFSVHASELPSVLKLALVGFEKGKFGVAVFFVLSGFLLGLPFWKRCDDGRAFQFRSYAILRLARILPAAWICFIVSAAVDVLYWGHGNDYTAIRLIAGMAFVSDWHWLTMFPVDSNGPLWSLSFEISAYVMMPIAFLVCRSVLPQRMHGWNARYIWSIVIFAALLLHAAAFGVLAQTDVASAADYGVGATAARWFPAYNAFGFFAMFAIGTLSAGIHTMVPAGAKRDQVVRGVIVLVAAALLPTLAFAVTAGQMGVPKPPYAFPLVPIAVAVFLFAAQHVRPSRFFANETLNEVVEFCAKISFGVYIWHVLVLIFVTEALKPFAMSGTLRLCLTGVLALGFTGIVSWVSYFRFEYPIIKRSRLWAARSSSQKVSLSNSAQAAARPHSSRF